MPKLTPPPSFLARAALTATTAAIVLGTGLVAAQAAPTAVTFNPGIAVPGQSQFTADKLNLLDYSRVDLGATSGTNTAFTETGYLQVNNASLNNMTFDPAGNRTAYSLYLAFNATGVQSAPNFTNSSTGTINTLTYTLYEAAGASAFGINGSNQPFVTNTGMTTAVASGSLIQGSSTFSASPLGAGANVTASFAQQLAGFIVSPANATLTLAGAFNNDTNIVTVLNNGQSFTLNGGGGDLTFNATTTPTPEPASLALIGSALVGLGVLRRKRQR